MIEVSTLTPDVLRETPGAPDLLAEQELVRAAREFCKYTRVWRHRHHPLRVTSRTREVYVDTCDADLIDVLAAQMNGGTVPNREIAIVGGDRLLFSPRTSGLLTLEIALQPKLNASWLPDLLVDQHLDALLVGTLARMLRIPGNPWTNPALAAHYHAQFEEAKGIARARTGGITSRPRTVRYGGL